MSYTALKAMRETNRERFGLDLGPKQPPLYTNRRCRNDLKSAALRFLHNACEELRFDAKKAENEAETGVYEGKSLKPGQIPYNMQMDLERLCLEKSLETFIDSGVAEDAYAVYYCYLEIFFGQYGKSKKMVELLSEYESNGSSLLLKHRDHYSHSVYVFALGLAIYETNENVRRAFKRFYGISTDENDRAASLEAAHAFLQYWGLTSLFHDIGYPFEIPFEQVLSYFEVDNQDRGVGCLFLAYHAVEALTALDADTQTKLRELYRRDFDSTTGLLAFDITRKLGEAYRFDEPYMLDVLERKPVKPDEFNYYMDHAFFSAARLFAELVKIVKPENLTEKHVDALSAIMLHNSLYKFSIAFYKDKGEKNRRLPLRIELHPLAWLLMLCDELQCWDRTAYGRNSRTELHPLSASFDFSGQAINAVYYYDEDEHEKIEDFNRKYEAWKKTEEGKEPRLKAYSDMAGEKQRFTGDIEKIVDTSIIPLKVTPNRCRVDRGSKHVYLSTSSFLHLYDFAVSLHGRNMKEGTTIPEMEEKYKALSLEYQLSTLNRARHFARYLEAIGCFYTDKPVDYEMVRSFGPRDAAIFAPMEHERWIREHQAMGWRFGKAYLTLPLDVPEERQDAARRALREQTRTHKLVMDGQVSSAAIRRHYLGLAKTDRDKDWKPFNRLLELLKQFDGLRIYRL